MDSQNKNPINCLNCGTRLELKFCFCPNYGQKNKNSNIRFVDFVNEFLEDLLNADSRFLKTIKVLISKPGQITKAFTEGQRLTYLPPIRLFLFMSLLLYFIGDNNANEEPDRNSLLPITYENGEFIWEIDLLYKKFTLDSLSFLQISKMNDIQLDSLFFVHEVSPDPILRKYIRKLSNLNTPYGLSRIKNGKDEFKLYIFAISIPLLAIILTLIFKKSKFYFLNNIVHSIHLQSVSFLLLLLGEKIGKNIVPFLFQYVFPMGVAVSKNQIFIFLVLVFGLPVFLLFLSYFHRSFRLVYEEGFWSTFLKTLLLVPVFLYLEFQLGEFLGKYFILII